MRLTRTSHITFSRTSHSMEPTVPAAAQSNAELTESTGTIDAATYLTAIKTQFQDKPEVYRSFIELMQDFNGQK